MRMPSRRAMAHAAGALALAATAVVTVGAPSHADGVLKPQIYSGRAVASAFHFFFNRTPGLFPLEDLFHVEVPYSTTVINSSGTIQAGAASIFPGDGPLGVSGLICGQVTTCPFTVPKYPLIATATYPTQPDSSAETSLGSQSLGGILKADPSIITAHADPDGVDAITTVATVGLLDVSTADSTSTRSVQSFKNGALITTATSDVTGLNVLGGLLRIDSLRSVVTSTVGGTAKPTASVSTVVTGAYLAGQPVSIDESGIHLASSGDGGAAQGGVAAALQQLAANGVTIKLAGASKTITKSGVNASTSGLFIELAGTAQDLPITLPPLPLPPQFPGLPGTGGDYIGSISIAGAGVSTFANGITIVDTNPGSGTNVGVSEPGLTPDFTGDPSSSPPLAVTDGPPPGEITTSPNGSTLAPSSPVAAPSLDVTSARLKTLILALVAYPAFLLLWRAISALAGGALGAPSRLPRAR